LAVEDIGSRPLPGPRVCGGRRGTPPFVGPSPSAHNSLDRVPWSHWERHPAWCALESLRACLQPQPLCSRLLFSLFVAWVLPVPEARHDLPRGLTCPLCVARPCRSPPGARCKERSTSQQQNIGTRCTPVLCGPNSICPCRNSLVEPVQLGFLLLVGGWTIFIIWFGRDGLWWRSERSLLEQFSSCGVETNGGTA